jgi:hypothetical protein
MMNTPQDPIYHSEGDVWTHTKMVVDNLVQHPWWHALDEKGRTITFMGALFHDLGKTSTTKHEPNGRITSKGHSKRGAIDTRILLWRENIIFEERESICALIEEHQIPFHIMQKENAPVRLMQASRQQRLDWLGCLTMADALGRTTSIPSLRLEAIEAVELFKMQCEDLDIWGKSINTSDQYTWQKFLNSPDTIDPAYAIRKQQHGSKVTILAGLPGMGKDTWIKKNAKNIATIAYDDMRDSSCCLGSG